MAALRAPSALDTEIAALTSAFEAHELARRLQALNVAAYPVLDSYGVVADAQLAYRRALHGVAVPGLTANEVFNPTPWLLSATPATVYWPSREVGADNGYVLGEVIGDDNRVPDAS